MRCIVRVVSIVRIKANGGGGRIGLVSHLLFVSPIKWSLVVASEWFYENECFLKS